MPKDNKRVNRRLYQFAFTKNLTEFCNVVCWRLARKEVEFTLHRVFYAA